MADTNLDYGIIRHNRTNKTTAVWIQGTSISYIFCQYCGSPETFDKMHYSVIYRGEKEKYPGPAPDNRAWL